MKRERAWVRTVVLALVVAAAAGFGLVDDAAYPGVSELQRQTWRAQDATNLVAVAVLLWARRASLAGSWRAYLVQLGLLGWLAYCYFHLAFGAVFGPAFLAYVAAASLSAFCFLDGLVRVEPAGFATPAGFPSLAAAWFLGIAGIGIAGLWLAEIVPGVLGLASPPNLHLGGLPNPTWVLDLAWLIPWALATSWQLARRHGAAQLNVVALLVLLAVLSVAMLAVTPFALAAGLGSDPVAAPQLVAFSIVFGVLGAIEAGFLWLALRERDAGRLGLREGWWNTPAPARR